MAAIGMAFRTPPFWARACFSFHSMRRLRERANRDALTLPRVERQGITSIWTSDLSRGLVCGSPVPTAAKRRLSLRDAADRDGTARSSFKDAWFWGVKAGGMDFNSATTSHRQAPARVEWLITRSTVGCTSRTPKPSSPIRQRFSPTPTRRIRCRVINLKNMRRLDMAAMAFPGNNSYVHPYAGIGFSLKQISGAAPADMNFVNMDEYNATQAYITQLRTGVSPYFVVGSQLRLIGFSVFFQGTASPAQKGMFLYNGKSFHLTYEAGLRYNIGSSINRD